jgi:hypothetical protein
MWLSLIFLMAPNIGWSGSLDAPAGPTSEASAMYTLEDLYNRLNAGTASTKRSGPFAEPSSGPTAATGHTLDDIMAMAPAIDGSAALSANVLNGKKFWGLATDGWGLTTGQMTHNGAGNTITPGTADQTLAAGYWSTVNTVAGDANLLSGNIKSDVNIFGITGTAIISTGTATVADVLTGKTFSNGSSAGLTGTRPPAPVPRTGQTSTRFTVNGNVTVENPNGNGTVTDNLTGLIWLKNANCFGKKSWSDAVTACNTLATGDCGLTDDSTAGQWRLPNRFELESLLDLAYVDPALSNDAGTGKWDENIGSSFTGVQLVDYWSSTTYAGNTDNAWFVYLSDGYFSYDVKPGASYVWPVRAGQSNL